VTDIPVSVLTAATPDDVEAIGRLLAQVSSRPGPPLTAERVGAVLQTPATAVLVARLDGQIAGMASLLTLTTFAGGSAYVEEVAVDTAARGRGVGRALLLALLELARQRGIRFVDLTSRPAREAANALYRSVGFEQRQTNGYRHYLGREPG
jgi:ribosomal protein S18 acetylase RimI-like enzyme